MEFVSVFFAILTPVFLITGLGYFARKKDWVAESGAQGVSRWTINLFLPAFVFLAIGKTELDWHVFFGIAGAAWLVAIVLCILGWGFMHWVDPVTRSGFLLLVAGINCGNFGLPMNKIAFGDQAAAYATIYYVAWTLFIQTVGVYIATHGCASSVRGSLLKVAKMPLPYAAIAGIIWNYAGLNPVWTTMMGKGMFQGINFIGSVAPFTMLFILGTGLYRAGAAIETKAPKVMHATVLLVFATLMRLLAGPIIAFMITQVSQMDWEIAQAIILQSSMPGAVQALIIAEATGVPSLANFVRKGIVCTTLLSVLSLPFLITLIR